MSSVSIFHKLSSYQTLPLRFDDARPTLSAPAGGRIRKASTLLDDMLQNDDDWLNTNATSNDAKVKKKC